MNNLFFDKDGNITASIQSTVVYHEPRPHITINESINISHYKIDLTTMTLVELPRSEWPLSPLDRFNTVP